MARKDPLLASLSAEGFSPPVFVKNGFNFSLYGTFSASVTLQRSFDGGSTWLDVVTLSEPGELAGDEPEGALYRFGVKAGNFTSGQANGRLGQ